MVCSFMSVEGASFKHILIYWNEERQFGYSAVAYYTVGQNGKKINPYSNVVHCM